MPQSLALLVNGIKRNSTNDMCGTEAHKRPGRWPYPECLGVRFPGRWPGLGKRVGFWPEDEIKLLWQSGQPVMPEWLSGSKSYVSNSTVISRPLLNSHDSTAAVQAD